MKYCFRNKKRTCLKLSTWIGEGKVGQVECLDGFFKIEAENIEKVHKPKRCRGKK